jgi:hypothetical protein
MIRFWLLCLNILIVNSLYTQEAYSQNIFGFATSNTFTFFNARSDDFKEKIQITSPQVLRFPGGAIGNFYHFNKPAYGMKIKEIDSLISGKFPKRARGLISYSKKKGHTNNYIDDFIALAKFSNAKAVLVANVLTEKTEDILDMIQKIKDSGVEIIGVELGSELSNKSYFDKGFLIDDYIKKSEIISNAIKKSFPEILTAVVAAPLLEDENHRHFVWNKKLSLLSFYDAIIVHSYAKVVKGKDQYGQMILEENEGDKESSFLIYKNRLLNFFNYSYPKEIKNYNAIFDNIPIWITEWNLQYSKKTGNTLLQGLFVANYFLELISKDDYKSIELTTFHNLAGRDFGGSIFQMKNNKTYTQSTFYPIQLLSNIFSSEKLKVFSKKLTDEIFQYSFFMDEKLKKVIVINWNDEEFFIDKNSFNKKTEYYSKYLFDLNSDGEGLTYKTSNIEGQRILINPYSLTLVE